MDAVNPANMKNYFDQLRGIFDEYDFENHPEAISRMHVKMFSVHE